MSSVPDPERLVNSLRADQCRRWRSGDAIPAEGIFAAHPHLMERFEDALVLIGGEVALRRERGETPTLDEYRRRFPRLASDLDWLFAAQEALESREMATSDSESVSQDGLAADPTPPLPGEYFPNVPGYQLSAELGRGAAGIVYRARQMALNRDVALKVVRPGALSGSTSANRFRAEAQAVARLQHPNVVQIFEVGEATTARGDRVAYVALEYVDGPTLGQVCGGQPQPADLDTIAHKCLRKEPQQRYGSAGELSDDLGRFLRREPIRARRESWVQAAIRIFRRNPVTASSLAAAVALLIIVAVGSILFAHRSEILRRESQLGHAEALVGRAHGIRQSRRPGQRFEALEAIRQAVAIGRELSQPPEWFAPIRDEAIATLILPDAHVMKYRTEPHDVLTTGINPNQTLYALCFAETGDIVCRRMSDHGEICQLPRLGKWTYMHFVAEDRLLFIEPESGAMELWCVDASPRRLWRHDVVVKSIAAYDVSVDGKVLVTTNPKQLIVVNLIDGKILRADSLMHFTREGRVALHPTLPLFLLYSGFEPIVELRDLKTGATVDRFRPDAKPGDNTSYSGAAWSPDGHRLAFYGGWGRYWYRFHPQSMRLVWEHTDKAEDGGGCELAFHPVGDRLYQYGWANNVQVINADSRLPVISSEVVGSTWTSRMKFDAAGRLAHYFLDVDDRRRIGRMEVAEGRESVRYPPGNRDLSVQANYDPTGSFAVVTLVDGLQFIDAATGRELFRWKLREYVTGYLAFDRADGLIINGGGGCFRYPYQISDTKPVTLTMSAPERVHFPFGQVPIACSDNGRTIAAGAWNGFGTQEYAGGWIQPQGEPAPRKVVGQQTATNPAVSPDGRYVAMPVGASMLWESTEDGRTLRTMPYGSCFFSPDGKRLFVGNRWYPVGRWDDDVELKSGAAAALNGDGSVMINLPKSGVINLVDVNADRLLGRIEGVEPHMSPVFSPDGDKILFRDTKGWGHYDLRRIGEGLEELGLASEEWPGLKVRSTQHSVLSTPSPRPIARVVLDPALEELETVDDLWELVDARALEKAADAPTDGFATFSAAVVEIERHNYDSALRLLNRTCELLPKAITPRQWRAYLLATLRRFDQALADADWVLERIEEDDFRLLRAEWRYRAKDFHRAITDCDAVIERNPSLARFAYGLRGLCHAGKGAIEDAKADQARFLEVTRNDVMSLDMAAGPWTGRDISLRHTVIAQLVVEKMRSLGVDIAPEIGHAMGRVLYRNDRFQEAADWLEQNLAKSQGKTDGFDLYVLAMCHHQLGHADQARDCLQRAAAWKPPKKEPPDLRARLDLRSLCSEAEAIIAR